MVGMMITTISMRSECAAATRSTRPPLRSACTAISDEPPMATAKNAVLESTPVMRCSSRPPPMPAAIANSTLTITQGR
ncbi:Uncharacterised protein [Mycobacteroides abscessus subsp. abscessus]|nr:Uncharacterised protein [Mycobacteroides abscessus subsp. abscessus]